ncbi:MAG: hypothetical protein JXA52_08470 [Planctomycetes bacterium]|nr:hypothetical protein [Planctomycetota bacterium]
MVKDQQPKGRPFVSIFFDCCKVYNRIYKNKAGTHYVGWCPRCSRKISLKIGPGGTDDRMFFAR